MDLVECDRSVGVDEALEHADSVVIGDAEGAWEQVIADARAGQLKTRYDGGFGPAATPRITFDRGIFSGKR